MDIPPRTALLLLSSFFTIPETMVAPGPTTDVEGAMSFEDLFDEDFITYAEFTMEVVALLIIIFPVVAKTFKSITDHDGKKRN